MAGQPVPSRASESDFPLSEVSILGALLAAFGLFLFTVFSRSPDRPPSKAEVPSAEVPHAAIPLVTVAVSPGKSEEFHLAPWVKSASIPSRPDLAPSPKVLKPETPESPSLHPAVMEKPSIAAVAISPIDTQTPKRQHLTEAELVSYLRQVPFVGLDPTQADRALRAVGSPEPVDKSLRGPEKSVLALLGESTILSLPFTDSQSCQLEKPQAVALETHSRTLRDQITLTENTPRRHPRSRVLSDRDLALVQALKTGRKWQTPEAIPALVQILQVESLPVRLQLVELLAGFETPEATQALLTLAVFDISPEVRLAANTALKRLYHVGYRRQLLEALRHPWAEVSWNAAETLIAVNDGQAATDLAGLLSAPDPTLPFPDKSGKMVKREMVGIQHSRNCLLCHAPSRSRTDLVRGLVGTLTKSGPAVSSRYYHSGALTTTLSNIDVMVRADVTYLRQDFSVAFVRDRGKLPRDSQRVDYVMRTREATLEEIAEAEQRDSAKPELYPQRDAVLFALQKLTDNNSVAQSKE